MRPHSYRNIILSSIFSMCNITAAPAWLADGLHWNWQDLEEQKALTIESLQFPAGFLWGVGSSAQQVEGDCFNNTWSTWEKEQLGSEVEESAGITCNQWNPEQMKQDVQLLKKSGINAYRFSVEWSKIEPAQGIFDQDALDHYEMLCKELVANGIQPVITLHHYTEPIWFADKGGFEQEENIEHYVRFCCTVFEQLNPYVHLWLTFNSPAACAINSYYRGTRPPGKKSMQLAAQVLANMLEAHVAAYHAMKKINPDHESRIGILHNIFHMDPWNRYNPFDHLACSMANKLVHTCIYDFFTTGVFSLWIPGKVSYKKNIGKHACTSLDFIGLNYYSHAYMKWFKPMPAPDEIPTDNPQYTLYPEGLYRALKELSIKLTNPLHKKIGRTVPIYITENGIATTDDATRDLFFKRTLFALSESCKEFDVRGYIHWAFLDNYEWGTYSKKYGIYHVDFATQQRSLKKGAQHFIDTIVFHRQQTND